MSEMISDYAGDMGSIRQRMVEHPVFAARQSFEARIRLWDGLFTSLNRQKQAGVAAS